MRVNSSVIVRTSIIRKRSEKVLWCKSAGLEIQGRFCNNSKASNSKKQRKEPLFWKTRNVSFTGKRFVLINFETNLLFSVRLKQSLTSLCGSAWNSWSCWSVVFSAWLGLFSLRQKCKHANVSLQTMWEHGSHRSLVRFVHKTVKTGKQPVHWNILELACFISQRTCVCSCLLFTPNNSLKMNPTFNWRLMFDTVADSCPLITTTKKLTIEKKHVWSPLRDMWAKTNIWCVEEKKKKANLCKSSQNSSSYSQVCYSSWLVCPDILEQVFRNGKKAAEPAARAHARRITGADSFYL